MPRRRMSSRADKARSAVSVNAKTRPASRHSEPEAASDFGSEPVTSPLADSISICSARCSASFAGFRATAVLAAVLAAASGLPAASVLPFVGEGTAAAGLGLG